NTVIEFGSMEAIKELVKLGLGVSILAPWITQKELQERSLVSLSLGRRKLKRTWGILHWRGRRLSLAEETFVSLCRTVTEELAQKSLDRHAACARSASRNNGTIKTLAEVGRRNDDQRHVRFGERYVGECKPIRKV